ncbi:unnamed protein product [Linum tenue]|uniref:Peptidase A1 domain-containing protein n=1 Tax=Linum tenue TaxID=586396 RepID=A0AAV0KM29_9ROSI|nr:unnamed protein product [Linum tenue]
MRADISSWMWFLFTLAVILAAVSPSSSTVSLLTTNVLHWEMSRLPNMDQLRAQDLATHARLFSGVPDLYVFGSAVPGLYGIYYTKVKLGSPPQEFSLQIDTGSDLLCVNAKSCANCPRSSSFTVIDVVVSPSATRITNEGCQCYLISSSVSQVFPVSSFNFANHASLILKPTDHLHQSFMDFGGMWCNRLGAEVRSDYLRRLEGTKCLCS